MTTEDKPKFHLEAGSIKIRWDHLVIENDGKRLAPSEGRQRKKNESPNATRCIILVNHGEYESVVIAYAYLSPKDKGRWSYSTGRKLSLAKALSQMFFGKSGDGIRHTVWQAYADKFNDAGRLSAEQRAS